MQMTTKPPNAMDLFLRDIAAEIELQTRIFRNGSFHPDAYDEVKNRLIGLERGERIALKAMAKIGRTEAVSRLLHAEPKKWGAGGTEVPSGPEIDAEIIRILHEHVLQYDFMPEPRIPDGRNQ